MGGANEEDGGQGTLREEWHWSSLSIQSPLPQQELRWDLGSSVRSSSPCPPLSHLLPWCLQLGLDGPKNAGYSKKQQEQGSIPGASPRAGAAVPGGRPLAQSQTQPRNCTVHSGPEPCCRRTPTQDAGTLEEAAPFHQIPVLLPQKEEAPST